MPSFLEGVGFHLHLPPQKSNSHVHFSPLLENLHCPFHSNARLKEGCWNVFQKLRGPTILAADALLLL